MNTLLSVLVGIINVLTISMVINIYLRYRWYSYNEYPEPMKRTLSFLRNNLLRTFEEVVLIGLLLITFCVSAADYIVSISNV